MTQETDTQKWQGRLLNIDLTDGTAKELIIPEEIMQKYLGGKGLGTWLLFHGLEPYIDPLSPENVLLVLNGPLTGTNVPCSHFFMISTKSPLTNTVFHSACGGEFGVRLKHCGYDGLVLRGQAPRPVYIDISLSHWEINDAADLWGKNVVETQQLLRRNNAASLCIGPAGENLVRFASIASGDSMAQRGGVGAVLGSKNVKAIRARGEGHTTVFDKEKLDDQTRLIMAYLGETRSLPQYGTPENIAASNDKGILPTRNFQRGTFPHYHKIGGEAIFIQLREKELGCPGCPIPCYSQVELPIRTGKIRVKGPGYQALAMLGSNLECDDLVQITRNNYMCYLLGLDPISTGNCLGLVMELAEKGRLNTPLHFGSGEEVAPFLVDIALRRGLGDEVAGGTANLVRKYGYQNMAMQVKGLEIPGYDPRGCWGQGLAYATCPQGASHIGSMLAAPESQGRPVPLPGTRISGRVCLTAFAQDLFNTLGSLVLCYHSSYALVSATEGISRLPRPIISFGASRLPRLSLRFLRLGPLYRTLSFATGIKYDRRVFLEVGERIANLERLFNLREGFTSRDDNLPLKFMGEPLRDGPSAGKVVPLSRMLPRYYRLRGWNEVGVPTNKQLQKLDISTRV